MTVSKLLREPFVHFVVLGALLFGLHAAFSAKRAPVSEPTRIVVSAERRAEIERALAEMNGRPASESELDQQIERWIDEEVLYREGVARGLDRDDRGVRQRVASKMTYVLETKIPEVEPTRAELESWFAEHRERWHVPALVDFVHVFVNGRDAAAAARAEELLRELANGVDPARLGDRFSGGRQYRGRKLEDLEKSFGSEFVAGLGAQPVGEWRLRRSRYGLHCVRVERHVPAQTPELSAIELDVKKDWQDARRGRERAAAIAELRRRYGIVRQP